MLTFGIALAALAAGGPAHAQGASVVTGTAGGTSDFVFRGLSLTRGKPAAQVSLDVEFPHEFYVGAFVATADPNGGPSPNFEVDAWLGRYWRLSEDFSGDLRISQYTYPEDPRRRNYNRTEMTATLGYRNAFYVAAIYSPNTDALASSPGYEEGDVWAVEFSGRYAFSERWAVSAGVGHYGLDEVYHDSYNYWNATLTASIAPFEIQLAWLGIDADADQHFDADTTGNRVALTALWRFSNSR